MNNMPCNITAKQLDNIQADLFAISLSLQRQINLIKVANKTLNKDGTSDPENMIDLVNNNEFLKILYSQYMDRLDILLFDYYANSEKGEKK